MKLQFINLLQTTVSYYCNYETSNNMMWSAKTVCSVDVTALNLKTYLNLTHNWKVKANLYNTWHQDSSHSTLINLSIRTNYRWNTIVSVSVWLSCWVNKLGAATTITMSVHQNERAWPCTYTRGASTTARSQIQFLIRVQPRRRTELVSGLMKQGD